jgi:hypothetical protein
VTDTSSSTSNPESNPEVTEPNIETSDTDDQTENKTKLESYRELVFDDQDPKLGIGDADGAAYALAFLGAPALALFFDWTGILGAAGLAFAAPAATAIIQGALESSVSWFKTSRVGVRLAHVFALLGVGTVLGMIYEPTWAGPAFGLGLSASFLLADAGARRKRRSKLADLNLAPALVHELVTMPKTGLDKWVLEQLESLVSGREALQQTLKETLEDDDFIQMDRTLHDVDMALAEMLDRAAPLSALMGRSDDRAQDAVIEPKAVFEELAASIDDICVTYLSYASGRDHSKLDALRARMSDFGHTKRAHDELESYLN